MIWRPRRGQRVRVWSRKDVAGAMPHHGREGVVVAAGRGPGPVNALVRFDDSTEAGVPRGNLVAR